MNTIYILRGLPGSGKTTISKRLTPDRTCEADQLQSRRNNFLKTKKCIEALIQESDEDLSVLYVFDKISEVQDIINFAKTRGFSYVVMDVYSEYKNTHNVKEDLIEHMKEIFEPYYQYGVRRKGIERKKRHEKEKQRRTREDKRKHRRSREQHI